MVQLSVGPWRLPGVVVAGVLSLPHLIRLIIRGAASAPERMLRGALNIIDQRTSSKNLDLLYGGVRLSRAAAAIWAAKCGMFSSIDGSYGALVVCGC